MAHTERETFVWWEEPTTGRVVWRYSGLGHGELSVTLHGLRVMLQLSVNSYNILLGKVCIVYILSYHPVKDTKKTWCLSIVQQGQSHAVVSMVLEVIVFSFVMWNALAQNPRSLNVPTKLSLLV